ncbi:response regulator [Calderihabitans maritimus]|uniref:Stage 0 sporulation protein A homolog n=1 Tax=Calderihabitans maritimus TaxID=1246530 RepID=A0A1Z5HQP5_9FIRM|nr:response regulator [Calderihabitans maritimus]GAW91600.1 response regulator [Calderihabitans maritimus]
MTKILVIDDDAGVRFTLQEIFKYVGWKTITAANGMEGVEKFSSENPDVVVVDYHMPVLDGLETVQRVRSMDQYVPIVVLTVDERQEIADQFLDAGATDFALKPIKAPDLIARLKVNLQVGDLQRSRAKMQEDTYVTKGIRTATMNLIINYLANRKEPATLEEITKEVGLAYQTVHRYMMYMVQEGKVETECDYGKVGRPKNRYRLKINR